MRGTCGPGRRSVRPARSLRDAPRSTEYVVSDDDLAFVGLDRGDLQALVARRRPLGMTDGGYDHFRRTLAVALAHSGVPDADVRLQGSSACLFSAPHKAVPLRRDEVFGRMRVELDRVPEPFELDDAMGRMNQLWPAGTARPAHPFFDLLYRLRIVAAPSDIDVQVSSGELLAHAHALAEQRGVSIAALQVDNPIYQSLRRDTARAIVPLLHHWAAEESVLLRRPVAVKVFGGDGPPDVTGNPDAPCSSHFKRTDWLL